MKYTSLPFEMNTWRDTIPYLFDRIPRITPYRGSPKKRVVMRSPWFILVLSFPIEPILHPVVLEFHRLEKKVSNPGDYREHL